MALATSVNQYLEEMSPWTTAKGDLETTGKTLYTALQAINALKVMFAPILPFSSAQLHKMLGEADALSGTQIVESYVESSRSRVALTYDGSSVAARWEAVTIPPGRELPKPKPLFRKLEPAIAEEELARLQR
jgi:methionyl-tRNA synthetase